MEKIFPGEVFAKTGDFDRGIRQLLPKYDEMLEVITNCLPMSTKWLLELGCGTGELTLKVLQRLPQCQVVSLDYSPRMLEFARNKIIASGYKQRWTGRQVDFGEWADYPNKFNFGTEFDACISSLAIHHLDNQMKLKLFQQIASHLQEGGCFWNADPILPESEALRVVYQAAREDWASQQGTDLSAVRAKLGISTQQGYSSQDQLATLESHLHMLLTSGFCTVAVPWKYYGLAVFGGVKNW